jgi:hypothetical protein
MQPRGAEVPFGEDADLAATLLHEFLDDYAISHAFEIYPGTHTSNVAFRIQDHVMPFFSENLVFAESER